jgi:1-deoxy-D-xylulose-5-phosphate reductoisomerase
MATLISPELTVASKPLIVTKNWIEQGAPALAPKKDSEFLIAWTEYYNPGSEKATLLLAGKNDQLLLEQCLAFRPDHAVMADAAAAQRLREALQAKGSRTQVHHGSAALEQLVADASVDAVMAAIVGAAGLPATLAAARAGKDVLLANKEALVMSGALFMRAVAEGNATLVPIDSEHSAIFQSLPRGFACGREGELERAGVARILLTASGGPFRTTPLDRFTAPR